MPPENTSFHRATAPDWGRVRPSRTASVVRQPAWNPTEKGLYVDSPLASDSRFLAAKAAEEAAAVKRTVASGKLPAY